MLRRDRQIRMQIHQLMDACLFAVSFWLAYKLRANLDVIDLFDLVPWNMPFEAYVGLYLILIPGAPLILEGQGFYARPPFCSRRTTAWMLFKGCFFTTLGLVLTMYLFKIPPVARGVVVWFGFISFGLVFLKEELLRWAASTKMAQAQYRRRIHPGRRERGNRPDGNGTEGEVGRGDRRSWARVDLSETPVQRLVEHAARALRQQRDPQREARLFRAGRGGYPRL